MDCIIPSHSVRPFCTAIACLSRIGKDMYLEFDPLEGLTLRTLNDAKSAYSSILWEPSFFEKCSAPPISSRKRPLEEDDEDCFSCRVTLRSLAAVVKTRRHVESLRLYSEISNDAHFLTFEFTICKTGMFTVVHRIPVAQDANRILATMPKEGASEIIASPRVLLKMLEPLYKKSPEVAFIINNVYKVSNCVFFYCLLHFILTLFFTFVSQIVTATTFQHGDVHVVSNALLNASAPLLLKTETCISVEELQEFEFRDDRNESDEAGAVPPPTNVNHEVALVFVAKEAKVCIHV